MTLSLIDPLGRGREMLERMARQDGPDSDTAHELLRWLDEQDDAEEELEKWDERVGGRDEAVASLRRLEQIEDLDGDDAGPVYEMLVGYGLVIGDEPGPFIEKALLTSASLHELCVEAGLLAPNDHKTDPLPLVRMFLPID